jgi:hypothetical protein
VRGGEGRPTGHGRGNNCRVVVANKNLKCNKTTLQGSGSLSGPIIVFFLIYVLFEWCDDEIRRTPDCSFCLRSRRDYLSYFVHSLLWIAARFSNLGRAPRWFVVEQLLARGILKVRGNDVVVYERSFLRKLIVLTAISYVLLGFINFGAGAVFHRLDEFHSRWNLSVRGGDGQSLQTIQSAHHAADPHYRPAGMLHAI